MHADGRRQDDARLRLRRDRSAAATSPRWCGSSSAGRLDLDALVTRRIALDDVERRVPRDGGRRSRPQRHRLLGKTPWNRENSKGRSGSTTGSRRRGGPRRGARRRARRTWCSIVLDDVGFAQLGCFGSDLDTPTFDRLAATRAALPQLPHDRAVLADALVPAAPGATTTRTAWAASPISRRASRATTRASRRRTRSSPRCSCRTATRRGRSASGTSRPRTKRTSRARRDRWPLGRGFERFYGFFGGETHQFAPALVHDNHFVDAPRAGDRRLPPHRGPRRPRDRVRPRPAPRRRGQAVLPLPRARARATRRTRRRPSGSRATAAASTTGWDVWREQHARAPARDGLAAARTRSCRSVPTGCRRGTALRRRDARCTRASWRRSPGFLSHTDHHVGRLLDALARDRRPRQHAGHARAPTTARAAKAALPDSINDDRLWNCAPRTVEEALRAHRRDRRPALPQQLPVGLDGRRQHAVPPLEARGARRRRRRPADRPLAAGHRRRRAGRSARSTCTRSTSCRPILDVLGVDPPAPLDGVSFAPTFARRRRAATQHTVQYYEMFGCRALYHDGWKAVDVPPDPVRTSPASTSRRGSSTTSPPTRRRRTTSPAERARAAAGDGRPCGGRRPSATTCCRSTTGRSPTSCSTGRRPRPSVDATSTGPARGMVSEESRGQHRATATTPSPRTSTVTARACCCRRARCSAAGRSSSDGALSYVHNFARWREYRVDADDHARARSAHRSASGSPRPATRRRRATLLVDGAVVGAAPSSSGSTPIRFSLTGVGPVVRPRRQPRGARRLQGPFPWTGASTASSSTSRAHPTSTRPQRPKPVARALNAE